MSEPGAQGAGLTSLASLAPTYVARRHFTAVAWDKLVVAVESFQAELEPFKQVFEFGCSYVTGSVARDEANEYSDLDLFIMDSFAVDPSTADDRPRRLNSLEQAHLLSTIDQARQKVKFKEFSQGGRFLTCHAFDRMVGAIGNAEDDFTNRFTARMLLLLNSKPLVNSPAYHNAKEVVLDRYWRQQSDAEVPFYPVFLLNDIRRWWGIVLLNFEYHNPPSLTGDDSPEQLTQRAKRRLNNLKLRYARLLASYTPILGILASAEEGGIRRSRLNVILDATPLERLDTLRSQVHGESLLVTTKLIQMYDAYLKFMIGNEAELYEKVLAGDWRETKALAYEFGDMVAQLIRLIGEGNAIYRYVIV